MAISANQKTDFKTLMEVQKTIPAYQRDFVWETDDAIQFVSNLHEAFEEGRDSYFCGSMVLFKNSDNIYEVVDGQQRTTVMFILLSILINALTLEQQKFKWKSSFLIDEDYRGHKKVFFSHKHHKVMKAFTNIADGLAVLDENTEDTSDILNGIRNLHECQASIIDYVIDNLGTSNDSLGDFIVFLTEKCFVVHYLADNMADALLTYSRLNAGGKKLGHLEVVKGLIYSAVEQNNDDWEHYQNEWEDFWEILSTRYYIGGYKGVAKKEIIKQETFLTYFLLTKYPDTVNDFCKVTDGFTPNSKVIDFLQSSNARNEIFAKPKKLIAELKEVAIEVRNLRTGDVQNERLSDIYKDIALLSQTQTQPLMFMLTLSANKSIEIEVLDLVFKLTFVFTSTVTGSGSTSGTWRSLTRKLRHYLSSGQPQSEIVQRVKQDFNYELGRYIDSNFKPYLQRSDLFHSTQQLKKILRVLEIILRQKSDIKEKSRYHNWYGTSVDIDHIIPKNNSFENDITNINTIGNAALLNGTDNRANKDFAFENEVKQKSFKRSEYLHTRAIVSSSQDRDAQGKEAKAVDMLQRYTSLNDDELLSRTNEIIGIFEDYLRA